MKFDIPPFLVNYEIIMRNALRTTFLTINSHKNLAAKGRVS